MTTKPCGAAAEDCPRRDAPCVLPTPASKRVRLVVLGESPGRTEVAEGAPFVGASGRLLNKALKHLVGVERDECHVTNAILCDGDEKSLAKARRCCAPRLKEELATIDAPVVAFGGYALQSALGASRKPSVLRYRGAIMASDDPLKTAKGLPNTIIASVHPAFILRDRQAAGHWTPVFEADMLKVGRVVRDGFVPPELKDGAKIVVAQELEQLRGELGALASEVVVDIETIELSGTNKGKGPNIHTNLLTCLVVADTRTAVVVPWSKTQSGHGRFFNGHQPDVVTALNACFASRTVITHNGPAYDHIGLKRAGVVIKKWDDTLLAYHVITSHFPKRLGHVVGCYLDAPPWKEWPHDVSLEELWQYCGRDGLYTAQAKQALWATLDDSDFKVYESDKRSAELCRDMSVAGFAFDEPRARALSAQLLVKEAALEKRLAELTGVRDLNPRSGKQLEEAFFKGLGAAILSRTGSGRPQLNKEVMRAYAASGDERLSAVALTLLEYRGVRKCRSTYIDNVHPLADGRVHCNWLSYGTETGRWSCQGPNLANLPSKRTDPLRDEGGIRSLYIAPPGRRLVAFDIKQAEFRIAAYLSGDPNMIAVCQDPSGDIHYANAVRLFGDKFLNASEAKQKSLRDLAKKAVFAVCYSAEAVTVHSALLAEGVIITLQQVEAMLGAMRRDFRDYYAFQADAVGFVIREGYVQSPILGRKRWLGHAPEPPKIANFPIQAGAADVQNTKLAKIDDILTAKGLDTKLVAMVYDAGYYDTLERDCEKVAEVVREVFAEPVTISGRSFVMPIDVKVGVGRWSEA